MTRTPTADSGPAGRGLESALTGAIRESLGTALAAAGRAAGAEGTLLARLARDAFASGLDLGMVVAAAVAVGGCIVALAWLPGRALKKRGTPSGR